KCQISPSSAGILLFVASDVQKDGLYHLKKLENILQVSACRLFSTTELSTVCNREHLVYLYLDDAEKYLFPKILQQLYLLSGFREGRIRQ
ncbi:MAG: hypothetical protein AAF403_03400, partial [Pseudomonadota bacterium]